MGTISSLPMVHDMDADYSPQYVKLARVIRARIEAGEYRHGDLVTAVDLARGHKVSREVALAALAMLAANGYVAQHAYFQPYCVTWDGARGKGQVRG